MEFPHDLPEVLFVDAESCKGIWPGLNDASLRRGPLPGDSLNHSEIAVARTASGDRDPQATHRGHGAPVADPHQPPLPRMSVYEHNEAGTRSWLLTQASKTYRGKSLGEKLSAKYARWTEPRGPPNHLLGRQNEQACPLHLTERSDLDHPQRNDDPELAPDSQLDRAQSERCRIARVDAHF